MRKVKAENHIHRLKRVKHKNGTKVFMCVLNCAFRIEVPFALGKQSLCNICGEEFTMNEYSIKLAKPHCTGCGKFKVTDEDGNSRFVQKSRPAQALQDISRSSIDSLRDRMSKVVTMAQDEDI